MVSYSFNRRFIEPIKCGLSFAHQPEGKPLIVPKRQTVRAIGKKRHARPGDALQLYHGMRTRQCFKIGDAKCIETHPIIIWVDAKTIAIELSKQLLSRAQMEEFACQDGFQSAHDMAEFWRIEHAGVEKFEGVLIKWEPVNG